MSLVERCDARKVRIERLDRSRSRIVVARQLQYAGRLRAGAGGVGYFGLIGLVEPAETCPYPLNLA